VVMTVGGVCSSCGFDGLSFGVTAAETGHEGWFCGLGDILVAAGSSKERHFGLFMVDWRELVL